MAGESAQWAVANIPGSYSCTGMASKNNHNPKVTPNHINTYH